MGQLHRVKGGVFSGEMIVAVTYAIERLQGCSRERERDSFLFK